MGSWAERIQYVAIQMVPFMMAVIVHEFGHGWMAKFWGDSTASDQGRLTLNPVPHIDPIGTVLFPLINMFTGIPLLIGWAKPVPVNPTRFRKYRPGLFWVSLAGPGMNFTLGFFSAFALCLLVAFVPRDFYYFEPFLLMTRAAISVNFALGIFNLLPIPPLDGSKVIESFLSYNATRRYEAIAQYSFWILMALMFTGALSILHYPIQWMSEASLMLAVSFFRLFGVAL